MSNGFALSTGFLPKPVLGPIRDRTRGPVDPRPELNNAAPSLQLHYRAFITTTGCPAPVPRIGTPTLAGAARLDRSLRIGRQVPTFRARAQFRVTPPSCRMPSGPQSGHPPDSSRVNDFPPVSTSSIRFRHVISGSLALVSPNLT